MAESPLVMPLEGFTFRPKPPLAVLLLNADGSVAFQAHDGREMLRLEADGSFYVQGRLTAMDREVYEQFKAWAQQLAPWSPTERALT